MVKTKQGATKTLGKKQKKLVVNAKAKKGKSENKKNSPPPRRWKPGTVAMREIKREQRTSGDKFALPKANLDRLIREIMHEDHVRLSGIDDNLRISKNAVMYLRYASESFMTQIFTCAQKLCLDAGRLSLRKKDLVFAAAMELRKHVLMQQDGINKMANMTFSEESMVKKKIERMENYETLTNKREKAKKEDIEEADSSGDEDGEFKDAEEGEEEDEAAKKDKEIEEKDIFLED